MLSGDIDINRSRYRSVLNGKLASPDKESGKYKSEISNLEKAELNIKVTSKDNITIDNNVARQWWALTWS